MRYGFSTLENITNAEEGSYQLTSLPGMRAGLKYNFSSSWGMRLTLGVEQLSVSRIETSDSDGSLPDQADYLEGKVGIGISRFL